MSETKICDACDASVIVNGHRDFGLNHRCPKAGQSAVDAEHAACPTHGTLVWVVGPYSTFRACGNRNCTAGKRGKSWRYCAPRGRGSDGDKREAIEESETEAIKSIDTEGFPPTKYAAESTETKSETTVIANTTNLTNNAQLQALQSLLATLTPQVTIDESTVTKLVEAAVDRKLAEHVSTVLEIKHSDDTRIEIDHPHPFLQRAIRLAKQGIPLYLWGPAGGGKTTAGQQIAAALKRESEIDTLDPTTFRSMVQGFCSPDGKPVETSFTRCWQRGMVYIADECDNGPGHVQTLFNSALANGHAPLAWGNVERGEGFAFVGTGNTPGRPTREFPDRKPMSAAFADRLYFMHWPLDEAAERAWSGVGGKSTKIKLGTPREITSDAWVDFVQRLRAWCKDNAPTIMITPRASIVGLRALQCGESLEDVADGLIFRGADADLKRKALNAVSLP